MQDQLLVWAVPFLTKAAEWLVDAGPARPSSLHRSRIARAEGPTATRRMIHDAFAGWVTFYACSAERVRRPLLVLNAARA